MVITISLKNKGQFTTDTGVVTLWQAKIVLPNGDVVRATAHGKKRAVIEAMQEAADRV